MRLLLDHGDYVAAGLPPGEAGDEDRSSEYREFEAYDVTEGNLQFQQGHK
jgi:hypothetical protein